MDARLPASLSPAVIEELLRGQMGWRGVVISDDLMMDAVARRFTLKQVVLLAVAAGNDILVFGNNTAQPDPELPKRCMPPLWSWYGTALFLCGAFSSPGNGSRHCGRPWGFHCAGPVAGRSEGRVFFRKRVKMCAATRFSFSETPPCKIAKVAVAS